MLTFFVEGGFFIEAGPLRGGGGFRWATMKKKDLF